MRTNIFSSVIGTEYFKGKILRYPEVNRTAAYYRMGETTGTVVVDEMGSYDGVYVNGFTSVSGLVAQDTDTAISFDFATTQYATLHALAPLIAATDQFTFSFGFIANTSAAPNNPLLGLYDNLGVRLMLLDVATNGDLILYRSGMPNFTKSGADLLDGIRHTIRITMDNTGGSKNTLHLDGIELSSGSSNYLSGATVAKIYLNYDEATVGETIIDEVVYDDWSRAITIDTYNKYLINSFAQSTEVSLLSESFSLNGSYNMLISETIAVVNLPYIIGFIVHALVSESMLTADNLYLLMNEVVNESFSIADGNTTINKLSLLLRENNTIDDSITGQLTMIQNVAELVNVLETNRPQWLLELSEGINNQDTVSGLGTFFNLINEDITALTSSSYSVYISVFVSEDVVLTEGLSGKAIFNLLINEQVLVIGGLDIEGDDKYTFVVNTKTLGLSEYVNYNFTNLSDNLACNKGGIYELNDDTDNEIIEAEVRTGLMDFGTSNHKQVAYAYLGLTNDGDLVLKTNTVANGVRTENFYSLAQNTAATDTRRVTLGRGIKGDMWQFAIANIDGADFNLDQLEILPLILTRRI